jgi:hypothetical protein
MPTMPRKPRFPYRGYDTLAPDREIPNSIADYKLVACVVACKHLSPDAVSWLLGFGPHQADRLLASRSGSAFAAWLKEQPSDFVSQFRIAADIVAEADARFDRAKG